MASNDTFEYVMVDALPGVEPDVPGLWIAATESATRYVFFVPAEGGYATVERLSWYSWPSRGRRPFFKAWACEPDDNLAVNWSAPLRVGARARIQMDLSIYATMHCTEVVEIRSYPAAATARLHELESLARAAMRDGLIDVAASAVLAGRIENDEQLRDVCGKFDIDVDEVQRRVASPS